MTGVAAPALRIVRRPKGSPHKALTAASQPVDDPAKTFKSSMIGTGGARNQWQTLAWEMYDLVGELRYYVGWRAGSCSRVRLVASEIDEETGMPTGAIDPDSAEAQRVADIVKAIAGGRLGQAQLIKRAVECLTVPGEVWIAMLANPDTTTWLALTHEEIKTSGRTVVITLPTGDTHEINPTQDSLFRIWNPRPRRAAEPDSPVRATLDSLAEIVRTTKKIRNADKSRLIGNGVVFVPHEMSLPAGQAPVSGNKPAGTSQTPTPQTPPVQQLQELLYQVAEAAIEDEDSMAALIPIFAGAPADQIAKVNHLKFDNTVTEIAIKTRNDAIARLAMGLDVAPERLLGLGNTSNHWSSYMIADEDVQLHVSPVMETVCQAINDQVLKIVLTREGIDPSKYVLWYDTSQLTTDPDKTDEATNAFDRGAINAEAYRAYLGLGDDDGYDFTTLEGWQTWAADRVSDDATLFPILFPLLATINTVIAPPNPAPAIQPAPDQQQPPPADNIPDGSQGEPNTQGDQPPPDNTAQVARQSELAVVERMLVNRALELAGKRRRTRADYNRLRDIPLHETHRYMGPVNPEDIPGLTKGWDAALEDDTLTALNIDADELRAVVRSRIRYELTRPMVDVVDL